MFIFPAVVGLTSAVFEFCWWKSRPTPAAHCTTAHPSPSFSLSFSPRCLTSYPPPKREHFSPALSVFIRKRGEVQSVKGRGATLSNLLRAANVFRVNFSYAFFCSFSLHSSIKWYFLVVLVWCACVACIDGFTVTSFSSPAGLCVYSEPWPTSPTVLLSCSFWLVTCWQVRSVTRWAGGWGILYMITLYLRQMFVTNKSRKLYTYIVWDITVKFLDAQNVCVFVHVWFLHDRASGCDWAYSQYFLNDRRAKPHKRHVTHETLGKIQHFSYYSIFTARASNKDLYFFFCGKKHVAWKMIAPCFW